MVRVIYGKRWKHSWKDKSAIAQALTGQFALLSLTLSSIGTVLGPTLSPSPSHQAQAQSDPAPGFLETSSEDSSEESAAERPTLRPGSSGAAVVRLQEKLQAIDLFEAEPNGNFGPQTEASVIAFQRANDLPDDGIVGSQTWAALEAAIAPPEPIFTIPSTPITEEVEIDPLRVNPADAIPPALWLWLMPLVPLAGGSLAYLKRRRATRQPPTASTRPPRVPRPPRLPRTARWGLRRPTTAPRTLTTAIDLFPLVALTAVSLSAFISYVSLRQRLIEPMLHQLNRSGHLQQRQISQWFRQQQQATAGAAQRIGQSPELSELLSQTNPNTLEYQAAYANLSTLLANLPLTQAESRLSLIAPNGNLIYATDPQWDDQLPPPHILTHLQLAPDDPIVVTFAQLYGPTIESRVTLIAPIVDDDGQRLGLLAADIDLAPLAAQLGQSPALPRTVSQAYLVGSSPRDLPRWVTLPQQTETPDASPETTAGATAEPTADEDEDASFSPVLPDLQSQGIRRVLAQNSGQGSYLNYDRLPVLADYRWLPGLDLGLLIEIDQTAVFQPARRTARRIFGVGLLLTGGLTTVLFWLKPKPTPPDRHRLPPARSQSR